MPKSPRFAARRLPDSIRRRLEVATAMAWEALVEAHVANALQFIALLREHLTLEEGLSRYLVEMDLGDSMGSAVRTRVLVNLEGREPENEETPALPLRSETDHPDDETDSEGWRRFRPDVVMREVRQRQRRNDKMDGWIQLAIARAEEGLITTHVDNAITFAALLEEHLPLASAVQQYIGAVSLTGGRAQSVYQRTMARLADVHLPLPTASQS
jgi:hypothetical protein